MLKPNTLFDLIPGEKMRITSLNLENVMKRRLLDLGFIPGFIVEMVQKSPLGEPYAYRVSDTVIALRKEECLNIIGEKVNEDGK